MVRMMANMIGNWQDVIDSRDVIERIEWLRDQCPCSAALSYHEDDCAQTEEERKELGKLLDLQEEAERSPDWVDGEALIRDSYFTEHAKEMADDHGLVDSKASWPNNHIDWEAAAEELQADYFPVDFDGVQYWIRG